MIVLLPNPQPWLRNWPKEVPTHVDYPIIPLQGLLESSAKRFPDKTAIVCSEHEITYCQLEDLSNQFAKAIVDLQVKKGDRVALFLPNIPEFVIAYFGALKAGATVTTISPLHREGEIEYQLIDSGAQTIISRASLLPILLAVKEKTQLKDVIIADLDDPNDTNLPPIGCSKTLSLKRLISQTGHPRFYVELDPNRDLAVLQYTGGTTGTAKGAMLTHKNLLSNAIAFAAMIQAGTEDTFLTALPLFHIYGMTTSMTVPISLGAKMVLMPKFEPIKALESIQKNKVTVFCGVPTMYQMLLSNPKLADYDLTSIRVCVSGASSLPPQVQKKFMEVTGGILVEGYGLTEASPVTHCTPVDRSKPIRIGSIGLPLPDTKARIVDMDTGETLEVGMTGELSVKGPQVMKGYWKRSKETSTVLCKGWLLTGDIAYMDQDGYFYITDRKKDLIKYKDYSVYPSEIEDIICQHPAVKSCAVVGKRNAAGDEIPKAFIVLKENAESRIEEIMTFVSDRVSSYKVIREIEFRKELPVSPAGKVLKRLLQEKL